MKINEEGISELRFEVKDEVICDCCGAVYGINEVKIEKELPWIDLTKEIGGDEI